MEDNIIIREIKKSDKEGLYKLFDDVWPEDAYFQHKKIDWILDDDKPGLCAEDKGKIIGSRTCFSANLYKGTERMTAVQFGGSCVDANYRRYGLFTRMNQNFLKDFFRTNNEVIFNVSVEASKKAYIKSGWVYIDAMSNIYKICRPLHFLFKTKGDIRALSGGMTVDACAIPDIDNIADDLLEQREAQLKKQNCLHIRYDKENLQWRLKSDSNIRMLVTPNVGICFYKTGYKNGLRWCTIGEIYLYEYSPKYLSNILKYLRGTDQFDVINTCITHAHPLYGLYHKNGFVCNPLKKYLNLGVRIESDTNKEICLNPNNWALSFMDIDTF